MKRGGIRTMPFILGQGKDLEEFFESTVDNAGVIVNPKGEMKGKFQTEIGKAWALEIASRRKKQ